MRSTSTRQMEGTILIKMADNEEVIKDSTEERLNKDCSSANGDSPSPQGFQWTPSLRRRRYKKATHKYVLHTPRDPTPPPAEKRKRGKENNPPQSKKPKCSSQRTHQGLGSTSIPFDLSNPAPSNKLLLWQPKDGPKRDSSDYRDLDHCLTIYSTTAQRIIQSTTDTSVEECIKIHKDLIMKSMADIIMKHTKGRRT